MNERISLILPNYCPDDEVRGHLDRFLDSLAATTDRSAYQFIVLEDRSSTPRLEQLADIYIRKEELRGYAVAVNLGVAIADHDLIVATSNDIVLPDGWLPRMIEDYRAHGPGFLFPMHYANPGVHRDQIWFPMWMTDRRTWRTVGYFDERLTYRLHDQKQAILAKRKGFSLVRTGNVVVGHVDAATYKKMNVSAQEATERQIMRQEFGVEHFHEWLARGI